MDGDTGEYAGKILKAAAISTRTLPKCYDLYAYHGNDPRQDDSGENLQGKLRLRNAEDTPEERQNRELDQSDGYRVGDLDAVEALEENDPTLRGGMLGVPPKLTVRDRYDQRQLQLACTAHAHQCSPMTWNKADVQEAGIAINMNQSSHRNGCLIILRERKRRKTETKESAIIVPHTFITNEPLSALISNVSVSNIILNEGETTNSRQNVWERTRMRNRTLSRERTRA